MKPSKYTALIVTASLLAACTEPNGAPGRGIENGGALSKQDVGIAAGVVSGGVLGSAIGGGAGNTIAIIGGGLLGGFLGSSIGKSLDDTDRAQYARASQQAMETGQAHTWKNSSTGNHGTITPKKRYKDDEGYYCRDYTQTIYIDKKRHTAHGTACREEDGSWKIVE